MFSHERQVLLQSLILLSSFPLQLDGSATQAMLRKAIFSAVCNAIDDSPYYVFVALCIVVIVVSLIKIASSNENIECFYEYFAVSYRAPDPSFF